MSEFHEPRVFLAGAGPGDPGLLTLRAAEVLARADLVLYDQLVPKRMLDFAKADAEKVCVRDLPGHHPDKYPHIYDRMLEAARAGKIVVRLKGGDPLIFGRGGEEAETLRNAGIAYEIIPGVTAALAAAAYLDVPLTHRGHTSAVAFITGHELPQKPTSKLDWEALAKFPGTLAVYMGIARLPVLVAELLKFGMDPNTPALIVERASMGEMRSVSAKLADLEAVRRAAGLEAPGLILIGEAVRYRLPTSWFEERPLFGRRVLVTRPKQQAEEMVRRLELLGAVPAVLPTIQIREPDDWTAVDAALGRLSEFDWLIFTSANGVSGFFRRLFARGFDMRSVGRLKFATVGPKTEAALGHFHLTANAVPVESHSSEGLLEQLQPHVAGERILLARANRGKETLLVELAKIASVESIVVYEQHDSLDTESDAFAALRRGEIEFIPLSSSNIARSLLRAFDDTLRGRVLRGEVKLVAISPETAKAIEEFHLPVDTIAPVTNADGLIRAIIERAKAVPKGTD